MANRVKIDITGDATKVLQELGKVTAKLNENITTMGRMAESGKKVEEVGKGLGGAFSSTVGPIKEIAGLLGVGSGIAGMVAKVREELENIKALQSEKGQTQITIAQSAQDVRRNMEGMSKEAVQGFLEGLKGISKETGVSQAVINSSGASALSASGQNTEASLAAVEQASKYLADRPDQIALFASSLLDMMKVTGTSDAATNQGYLSMVGAKSRVVDPLLQAQNIAPALIGMRSFGATAPEASAMFSALSEYSADATGAITKTASIRLAQQMSEFFHENKKAKRTAEAYGFDSTSMTGQLQTLWSDPKLAKTFVEGSDFGGKGGTNPLSLRAPALGAIRSLLLDGQSSGAKTLQGYLQDPYSLEEARKSGQNVMERRSWVPGEQAAMVQRSGSLAEESMLEMDKVGGMAGVARETTSKALRASGMPLFARKPMEYVYGTLDALYPESATERYAKQLELQATALERPITSVPGASGPGGYTPPMARAVTDQDREMAATLRDQSEALRKAADAMNASAAAMNASSQTQKAATRQGTRGPATDTE